MTRFSALTLLILALVTPSVDAEETGFTLLLGKDLSGWKVAPTGQKDKGGESLSGKTESPTKRFVLADGVLTLDDKVKGDLSITTEKTWAKDAHFKFDFKPGKGCNNDLYFRGIKFDINPTAVKAIKLDEWNAFEFVVVGENAEIKCNGESVKKLKAKAGATPFSVRAEFGPIQIKNLRVKAD
jgi:Domain of Unknown Function (DUF1080)